MTMDFPWTRRRGPDDAQLERLESELAAAEEAQEAARESLEATRKVVRAQAAALRVQEDVGRMNANDPYAASVARQILCAVRERRKDRPA
jgi:hypothetical protein